MWRTSGPDETREVGRTLAAELAPGGVLLLRGALAAGKTVLAQGVAAGLGIDPREVQSPTFTLVREHSGPGGRLVHLDLYRLEPRAASGLGLEEILCGPGVKVVEWAERLPLAIPGALTLELVAAPGGERQIREVVVSPGEPQPPPYAAGDPVAGPESVVGPEKEGGGARETR